MPRIGVRELKIHISEVVKDVQANNQRYTITNRGEPVALLVPYSAAQSPECEDPAKAWNELADMLRDIGRKYPSTESTQEVMDWLRGD